MYPNISFIHCKTVRILLVINMPWVIITEWAFMIYIYENLANLVRFPLYITNAYPICFQCLVIYTDGRITDSWKADNGKLSKKQSEYANEICLGIYSAESLLKMKIYGLKWQLARFRMCKFKSLWNVYSGFGFDRLVIKYLFRNVSLWKCCSHYIHFGMRADSDRNAFIMSLCWSEQCSVNQLWP